MKNPELEIEGVSLLQTVFRGMSYEAQNRGVCTPPFKLISYPELTELYQNADCASRFAKTAIASGEYLDHFNDSDFSDVEDKYLSTTSLKQEVIFLLRLVELWPKKIEDAIDVKHNVKLEQLFYFGRLKDVHRCTQLHASTHSATRLINRFAQHPLDFDQLKDLKRRLPNVFQQLADRPIESRETSRALITAIESDSGKIEADPLQSDQPEQDAGARADKLPKPEGPALADSQSVQQLLAGSGNHEDAADLLQKRLALWSSANKCARSHRNQSLTAGFLSQLAADYLIRFPEASEKEFAGAVIRRLDKMVSEGYTNRIFGGKKNQDYIFLEKGGTNLMNKDKVIYRIIYNRFWCLSHALEKLEKASKSEEVEKKIS